MENTLLTTRRLSGLMYGLMSLLVACCAPVEPLAVVDVNADLENAKVPRVMPGYVKPGAAVSFVHNYQGPMDLGATVEVRLSFLERYDSGNLTIRLAPDAGLQVLPAQRQFRFAMNDVDTHTLEIQMTMAQLEKQYLTLFVQVEGPKMLSASRVFALAIKSRDEIDDGLPMRHKLDAVAPDTPAPMVLLPVIESAP